jgi:prevent-host-death family protein
MKKVTETIASSDFKARCLGLLDEVEKNGREIIVTKRGRRVARLCPLPKTRAVTFGTFSGQVVVVGDIISGDFAEEFNR